MITLDNLTGQRFGRWVVLRKRESDKNNRGKWWCRCDCGREVAVCFSSLSSGHSRSCGCLRLEVSRRKPVTHDMSYHPAYGSFNAAKARCRNIGHIGYANYGGRGVRFNFVSFEEFWNHLGDTWKPGLTIDRIDNEGHYEVGNVRWASRFEQARNTRCNVWVEHTGKRLTLSEWSRETGIRAAVLSKRHKRFGADPVKLFAAPSKVKISADDVCWLREWGAAGWPQTLLAHAVGCSQSQVSAILLRQSRHDTA